MERSITLALSWWHPDHNINLYKTLSVSSLRLNRLNKVNNLKIWFPMIWPMPASSPYLQGTYGYGYSKENISYSPFYREAINFFNTLGFPLDIETVIDNPSQADPAFTVSSDVEKAKQYGSERALFHYNLGFKPWTENGGKITTINLDDPLNKIVVNGFAPDGSASKVGFTNLELAIECTLSYMRKMKELLPWVQFNYTTNLPSWNCLGFNSQSAVNGPCYNLPDYSTYLSLLLNKCIIQQTPIKKLSIDNPYIFANAMLFKLITFSLWMSNFSEIKQELIINTASANIKVIDPENRPQVFDLAKHIKWDEDVKKYMNIVKNNLPLISSVCCQTWMDTPLTILPSVNPSYSLLNTLSLMANML